MVMTLYKYKSFSDEHLISLLTKGEIYLCCPSQFNDVYDSAMFITAQLPEGHELQELELYANEYASPKMRERLLKDLKDNSMRQKFLNNLKDKERIRFYENTFINYRDRFCIFCASGKWNSILMWSHYADSHKGICIGFNTKVDNYKNMYLDIQEKTYGSESLLFDPVNYKREFKNIDFFHSTENERTDYMLKSLRNKYTGWEYENEYRAVVGINNASVPLPGVIHLKGDYISEIIFGCNTDDSDIYRTIKILSETYPFFDKVKFFQLYMSNKRYQLLRNKLDIKEYL